MPDTTNAAKNTLLALHKACESTFDKTFNPARSIVVARQLQFADELLIWNSILSDRKEFGLFDVGHDEFIHSVLAVVQGQYRSAFKSLRLNLELYLQGILLSVNLIEIAEWIDGRRNTNWAAIVDRENGIFSVRFSSVFFDDLKEKTALYLEISKKLYSELSQCTHGNVHGSILIPKAIDFDEGAFAEWVDKVDKVRTIIHFSMSLRYLKSLGVDEIAKVSNCISDELGYIPEIRNVLGGPIGG